MSFLKFLRSLKIVDYKTGSFYTTKNFRENYFAKTGIDLTEQRIGQLLRKNGVRYFMFNVDYPKKKKTKGLLF